MDVFGIAAHQSRSFALWFWLFIFIIGLPEAAHAGDIRLVHTDSRISVIVVSGVLASSDGEAFAAIAAHHRHALVLFSSPGGSLIGGLQIGQIIRLRHYITFVPQDETCASACAFAWLAGTPRAMQPDSHIGFHAAFVEESGAKVETGVGNALVGAYLNNLGLSMEAIVYVEQAHPDDITWLDMGEARRIGLSVDMVSPTRRSAKPAPDRAEPAVSPSRKTPDPELVPDIAAPAPSVSPENNPAVALEDRARAFLADYFAHWSEANNDALDYFRTAYASQVNFYGKDIDRTSVLASKRDYTERWPVRVYTPVPENLKIFCNDARRTCAVSGTVDWDSRNPKNKAHSAGAANFMLVVAFSDGGCQIISEHASVITRN